MNDEPQVPAPRPHAGRNGGAPGQTTAEQLVNGRYRLLTRLGIGRLGPVYEAADVRSSIPGEECRAAVQLIDPKLIAARRFAGEFECGVKTLEGLAHSNIVRLLDAGRDRGRYFLVTEAPDGASLRYVLDDAGRLPFEEAAAVTRSVGGALQYLHAKSIVHGNLKPDNVFVTFDFEVKLLDIVPPEWPAAGPGKPDERNDVYGLACLAYEMLAGRHPFNENTPDEARHAGLWLAPIGLLSTPQWRALAAALEFEPVRRTPTVARFLDELGIADTEQLRALVLAAADGAAPVAPDFEPALHAVPASEPLLPAHAPAPESELIPTYAYALRPKRSEGARARFFLLLLLMLGVLAYANRERLQEAKDAPAENPTAENATPAVATPLAAVSRTDSVAQKPSVDPATQTSPPTVAAPGPPQVGFARPVVTVKESEVAVRLIIRRSGDLSQGASIAWWPQDGSAIADHDFADLGVRVEQFTAGEAARPVFVPLINDADREGTESFNVYLGRSVRGRRIPEPQAGMRVDLVDDD